MNTGATTEKLEKLIDDLTRAHEKLTEALGLPPTRIHKDATIQRFEFTVELSWKVMQEALRYLGEEAASPREAIRVSARIDMVDSPESWLTMLTARNLTAHVYRESVADEVYEEAKQLPALVQDLLTRVKKKM